MSILKNLVRVSFTAVLAIGLAACGGSGTTMDPPDLAMQRTAATAAATAAAMASSDAADAVTAVDGSAGADTASYAKAREAAAAAAAASAAAADAKSAADAATTTAEADMHEATAEAEQAKAEAALADAEMYAGMVSAAAEQAEADRIAAEQAEADRIAAEAAEAAALTMARGAADMAADAAEMAAYDAAAAVAAVADSADADSASYEAAQTAAANAMAAAMAARDASDAATRATSSMDAQASQATAEAEKAKADTALADAMTYAGMVTTAQMAADEAERERMAAAAEAKALEDAKAAAMAAVTAASEASQAASQAVLGVAGSKDLNAITAAANARAEDAAADAAAAHLDAVAANARAQAAMTSADAAMYQGEAEAAQATAEAASTAAMTFAAIVTAQQDMADDAATEMAALEDAQMKASDAATAARTAADAAAEAAARVAHLAGTDSAAAMRAQTLSMEAETAAMAAEMARDNAADDTASADAIAEQIIAAQGQQDAETNLATLVRMRDDAQVAYDATHRQLEARDLADAKEEAQEIADEVNTHYMAAKGKAADARAQANAARASARMATGSRTDYENADKYATMAEAEATKAEAARDRAMQANADAMMANTAAQGAETSGVAKTELAKVKAANVIATEAHTGDTGAGMAYMAAKSAAEKAGDASEVHVLSFLQLLNGADTATAAAKKARLDAVNTVLSGDAQAATPTTGLANATGNTNEAATVATVTWRYHGDLGPAGDVGGTGDEADTKPGEGLIDVTLNTTPELDLTRDDEDGVTAGVDETNFVEGPGLGDFAEYHITAGTGAAAKARTIVFTDKEQARAPIEAETVTFTNLAPVASRLRNFVAAATGTTYDHDDDPRTAPIAVAVTCLPEGTTTCTVTENSAGTRVTAISGYKVSTDAQGVAVTAATGQTLDESEDTTYLAFGAWLVQAENGGAITYGAFANGSGTTNQAPSAAPITGTATYNGKAAGVHNTPSATNFFHADATLTANFGNATALGTITGRIHNIMSGGQPVSNSIYLDRAADATDDQNIDADGTFDGRARMGAGVTNPQTGDVTYPYEGVWNGRFYNAAPATPANQPPLSAAGTFGVQHRDRMGTADDASDDETSSFIGAFGAHRDE